MQDIISKIIEMDEAARKLIAKAEQEKIDCETEIANSEEKIKKSYVARAKKKISAFEADERAAAQKTWKKISDKNKGISNDLDRIYEENFDKWVDTLVKMTIGG